MCSFRLEDQLQTLIDASPPHIQRHFACDCAARVLKRAHETSKSLWGAIEVSRRFAEGKSTVHELSAARSAVRGAAQWNAALDAARGAARDAVLGAALDAVWDTARHAAWGTSSGAANGAARDAVWSEALNAASEVSRSATVDELSGAAKNAAWNAAWETAWNKERKWQVDHLQFLIADYNATRASFLRVLQQRTESVKPIFVQYAHDLEERAFE